MRKVAIQLLRAVVLSVAATFLAGGLVWAQERPLFSAESELVVLHVAVKDNRGAYVTDLPPEAFGVFEDGEAQTIQFFSSEDTPVTVGLLVDGSASMWSRRNMVVTAAGAFASSSHPGDEMFVLGFNESVSAALPDDEPFTSDPNRLQEAVQSAARARGMTALYDAIWSGLDYLEKGTRDRHVLVVVSDGGDNASTTTLEDVLTRAQASNAVIYAVGLVEPRDRDADPPALRELAAVTGGEAFFPRADRQIVDALEQVARDIRHTYTLGYVPTNAARDGAFRKVRVVVESPRHRRLNVRARTG